MRIKNRVLKKWMRRTLKNSDDRGRDYLLWQMDTYQVDKEVVQHKGRGGFRPVVDPKTGGTWLTWFHE